MTKLLTLTAIAALILAGLGLWLRFGSAVWFDAAIAFCA